MYGFKVRRVTIFHIKFFKSGRVAKSFIITKGQEIQNTKIIESFFVKKLKFTVLISVNKRK